MNRVEFFLNNQKIGESTVAPYTLRWNIQMSDTPIRYMEAPVMAPVVITQPDGTITATGEISLTYVLSVTQTITDPAKLATWPAGYAPEEWIGYQKVYSGGFSIISTTQEYLENHLIHVVAYDSAGNEAKTEPIQIQVKHKEKEEEEESEEAATEPQGFVLPSNQRQLALGQKRKSTFINLA
jgi:hypothetical protein